MPPPECQDPRFAPLFEPLRIGPVTAPNRFYQVPHCTGMGNQHPRALAAHRAVKAEGGWGVVNSEYCSVEPRSDDAPFPYASLWDSGDVRAMAAVAEAVHAHGALAGVELWHGGRSVSNLLSREPPIGVRSRPGPRLDPVQCAAMDTDDIRALRAAHGRAVRRALSAGYDLVYVYATHGYLLSEFLSPDNPRRDAYGGSVANRVRLVRELLEDTLEIAAGRAAVALRFSAAGESGRADERREMVDLLAELPDLWDLNIDHYETEMGSSRFVPPAALEADVAWVKARVHAPVVTVGRYTDPEAMLALVRRGISDLVGAARPSIADPFLPRKIAAGRAAEIRECIGCNLCYAGDARGVPIRCTQNPTVGEEWRRGWHPEIVPPARTPGTVLVVGAGPAGLECARVLGLAGHRVLLADVGPAPGGRVTREAALPGLAAWARVRDYRLQQLHALRNVELYPGSEMDADAVLETGASQVVLATGARWRGDGIGRWHGAAVPGLEVATDGVFTPDDIMAGRLPEGRVLVFDDDHYYMAPACAERLREAGCEVALVTPQGVVSGYAVHTAEQAFTQARLIGLGVRLHTSATLASWDAGIARLACVYTGTIVEVAADALLTVTAREPVDALYAPLMMRHGAWPAAGLRAVQRAGDCLAPASIAAAVHAGHLAARSLEAGPAPAARERPRAGA